MHSPLVATERAPQLFWNHPCLCFFFFCLSVSLWSFAKPSRSESGIWKLGFWSEANEGQPKISALQSITQIGKHFRGEKKTNAQPLLTNESFIKEPSKSVIRGVCTIIAAIYYGFWKTRQKPPSLAAVVINPKPILFLSRCLSTSRLALWFDYDDDFLPDCRNICSCAELFDEWSSSSKAGPQKQKKK
jgi:hypothetical protein